MWQNAAKPFVKPFAEGPLAPLVGLIAVINAYHRVNVITGRPAGNHRPGVSGRRARTPRGGEAVRQGVGDSL